MFINEPNLVLNVVKLTKFKKMMIEIKVECQDSLLLQK